MRNNLPEYFIHDQRVKTGSMNIANSFNEFFAGIAEKLANVQGWGNSNTGYNFTRYLSLLNKPPCTFGFSAVSADQVIKCLNLLQNKSSCGNDMLSTSLLKKIFSPLLEPLTVIINQTLRTGIFPDRLKVAKVIPLYKKGDAHSFSNY